MSSQLPLEPAIGVIGGSGLYDMEGLDGLSEISVATPFGDPSDRIVGGRVEGRKVFFLPRHGIGHRLLPHEINHRANLWALRSLGVRWLISVSAVGSLDEEFKPRDLVVPDQLIDRTGTAAKHTFFGRGIAAHVGFAEPYCPDLRAVLLAAGREVCENLHDGGTYLCMNGPAFSTRAEAAMHRMMGADLIGMTNAPEARLAREAEISMAALALVTDYDCWKEGEAAVEVDAVIENLRHCTETAKRLVRAAIPNIPAMPASASHRALDAALFTARENWPAKTAAELAPILGRFG